MAIGNGKLNKLNKHKF